MPNEFDKYDEPRLHMEKLLSASLVEFDLPLRLVIALDNAGIRRLGDLVKHSKKELLSVNRLGIVSVNIISLLLERLRLNLKAESH